MMNDAGLAKFQNTFLHVEGHSHSAKLEEVTLDKERVWRTGPPAITHTRSRIDSGFVERGCFQETDTR